MAVEYNTKTKRFRVQFNRVIDGTRLRKSKLFPKGTTREQAEILACDFEAELYTKFKMKSHENNIRVESDFWKDYVQEISKPKGWISNTIVQLKHRAKTNSQIRKRVNINCELTSEELIALMLETGGRCQVTGLLFSQTRHGKRSPYNHSVDRIDCSLGYTYKNCRIVCMGVNIALSDWGENVFKDFAVGYVMSKYSAHVLSRDIAINSFQKYTR